MIIIFIYSINSFAISLANLPFHLYINVVFNSNKRNVQKSLTPNIAISQAVHKHN